MIGPSMSTPARTPRLAERDRGTEGEVAAKHLHRSDPEAGDEVGPDVDLDVGDDVATEAGRAAPG